MARAMPLRLACVTLAVACLCALSVHAYLPGAQPSNYQDGAQIGVRVLKLDSTRTQLPYDYYSLPFCAPDDRDAESEILELSGDHIEATMYKVIMGLEETCQIVCRRVYTHEELAKFANKIEEEYRVNWLLDSLPAATKYFTLALPSEGATQEYEPHYEKGFALGFVGHADVANSVLGHKYLNNHLRLIVFFHQDGTAFEGSRVVGFEVEAYSVAHRLAGGAAWAEPTAEEAKDQGARLEYINRKNKLSTCSPAPGEKVLPQPVSDFAKDASDLDRTVIFTYDVHWELSKIRWASRWDLYLQMADSKIHWFSIINSIMIVLFLSGIIAAIMLRILHRDLTRYNTDAEALSEEEQKEETGWKLIHGDVFRPPQHGNWLAVLVGTGVQVFGMVFVTLIFAALGFLSPANRGGLMMALLLIFVFMGMLAGYYSTRIYKMFQLTEWKRNTLITALFFPGIVFTVFFILNLFVWHEKSSGAVPFGTLVALLVMWFGISVPLVYFGSYIAFRKPAIEHPVRTNTLHRLLPPDSQQTWYTNPQLSVLLGGILPFAAVFIEIFFIMSSVWLNQAYYMFRFLFVVFLILIITCTEITIVLCYFQLCNEDYHWWWRSFLTPGSSALYLYLYSVLYFFKQLSMVKLVSGLLFFGYMLLVCFAFFVLTGTIGYFACFMFVTKIYASIKID